ncbi:MAG: YraN family protein, partial [Vicinamibacterales bacterium]|nr:YraN family protein [Vicinamibacterales bacterium]
AHRHEVEAEVILVRAEGKGIAFQGSVSDQRVRFGKRGEDLACEELRRRGYVVLERRFRTRRGEIDIVARDSGVIVFVEVKARTNGSFGGPLESITWQKRQRLAQMASTYLFQKNLGDAPCRFDVVSIVEGPNTGRVVEVIQGAFEMGM